MLVRIGNIANQPEILAFLRCNFVSIFPLAWRTINFARVTTPPVMENPRRHVVGVGNSVFRQPLVQGRGEPFLIVRENVAFEKLSQHWCTARRERELRLQPPQRDLLDQVAFDLLQDEVGALARRQNVLAQIEKIDARPDRRRSLNRLRVRQRRVAVKV
jgi:hypothetical protein